MFWFGAIQICFRTNQQSSEMSTYQQMIDSQTAISSGYKQQDCFASPRDVHHHHRGPSVIVVVFRHLTQCTVSLKIRGGRFVWCSYRAPALDGVPFLGGPCKTTITVDQRTGAARCTSLGVALSVTIFTSPPCALHRDDEELVRAIHFRYGPYCTKSIKMFHFADTHTAVCLGREMIETQVQKAATIFKCLYVVSRVPGLTKEGADSAHRLLLLSCGFCCICLCVYPLFLFPRQGNYASPFGYGCLHPYTVQTVGDDLLPVHPSIHPSIGRSLYCMFRDYCAWKVGYAHYGTMMMELNTNNDGPRHKLRVCACLCVSVRWISAVLCCTRLFPSWFHGHGD